MSLGDIVTQGFGEQYQHDINVRSPIERAFMGQMLTPGANYGAALTAAQGMASNLFAPGGDIQRMMQAARGSAVGAGWAPEAALGDERGIARAGYQRVADTFAQGATQLEGQRINAMTNAFAESQAGPRDTMESIYSGRAGELNYGLARRASRPRFLGLF
jgi:hypothetical protein